MVAKAKVDNMTKINGEVHIGEYSEGHLLKLSKKLVQEKSENTRLFDKHAEADIPQFDKSGEQRVASLNASEIILHLIRFVYCCV